MRTIAVLLGCLVATVAFAQEKPVPKDSMRVTVRGCAKGAAFTAGPRTEDQVGRADIPEGTRLRMNAPKKLRGEINAHDGEMIQITGLMKKGQYREPGIPVGGGVRVAPGAGGIGAAGGRPSPEVGGVNYIDVESWQPVPGSCPS